MGLAFGPALMPPGRFSDFSATTYTASNPDTLVRVLEAARRANTRLFISFTGNQKNFQDSSGGFDIAKWKQRVDCFRGLDLTPYIAEETIVGHVLLDEPYDKANWNGKPVSQPQIEELARYGKEIWPSLATVLRTHYDYIAAHLEVAKSLGQAVIGGVNVLDGGSKTSGIPGHREGKFAMSADELRSWGGRFLADPNICGFICISTIRSIRRAPISRRRWRS